MPGSRDGAFPTTRLTTLRLGSGMTHDAPTYFFDSRAARQYVTAELDSLLSRAPMAPTDARRFMVAVRDLMIRHGNLHDGWTWR